MGEVKVYVVTKGEHDDAYTAGVYSTLEAAKEANPLDHDGQWVKDEEYWRADYGTKWPFGENVAVMEYEVDATTKPPWVLDA